jgi:Glu-tRNA(Gln) amidotransferase subunit E-like FAD-binding protein
MNYKELGLKVGLEIHFQLDVEKKLFCNCSTKMSEKPYAYVIRKLKPVYSELGEIDVAAQYEYLRNRTFVYEIYKNETCLVELDEEPPHDINQEALKIALQIAKLFNCKIPDKVIVMRKIVIDGSNTSGFQRTALIGYDGYFEFKNRKIPITQICLEEDSAAIDREENEKVYYKLNRLGIPLIEIDTGILEGFEPKEIEEIAYHIFLIASSTKKIKKQLGAIRQDVNVSIEGGNRVEIKGVQRLSLISKVIEKEVERQLELIKQGKKIEKETRAAKEDGTTVFLRPLPGAGRMYPETDIKPINTKEILEKLEIPEPLTKIIERYEKKYKLSKDLINNLIKSDYFFFFEEVVKICKNLEPSIIASILTSILKEIERKEKTEIKISEERLIEFFKALNEKRILKEASYEILKEMNKSNESLEKIVEKLNLKPLSKEEVIEIIKDVLRSEKNEKKALGIVISKIRGKYDINDAIKLFEEIKKSI